jgi:cysteine desulfurase
VDRFYFDHNATTPVSPEVMEAFLPLLTEAYGNASSIHHFGQTAKQKLESARRNVAQLLGCNATDITWTSGGTESNNLAIFGVARNHVVTTAIEHPAVLGPCEALAARGVEVTIVKVGSSGVVDPADVRAAIRPGQTSLVSVMHANNEVGTIQPIEEIAAIAHEHGALMHSDGVQAVGKIDVRDTVRAVDMYTLSGHKLHAPKGIGALYARKNVKLAPLTFGGHQERDRRPGTENVAGAVALGRAAQIINENGFPAPALRDRLERGVLDRVEFASVNCSHSPRLPNTTNIRFEGIEGEPLVIALDLKGFAVSSGAACSSGAVEPSHVLTAIGLSKEDARSCLRISLGRFNDESQVDALIEAVAQAAHHLYRLSPVYAG